MDDISIAIRQLREEGRFFQLFSQEELALLFPFFGVVHYPAKAVVFAEGEPTMVPFFVVVEGALEISKKTDFGRPFVLAKITRGALMGQVSLNATPRVAPITAVALKETEVLMMSADRVAELLEKHPTIGIKILKEIIRVQNIRMLDMVDRMTASL